MIAGPDPRSFTLADVSGTLRAVGPWWDQLCGAVPGGTEGAAALICASVAEQARLFGLAPGATLPDVVARADALAATLARPAALAADDVARWQQMAAEVVTSFGRAGRALHAGGCGAPAAVGEVVHLARSGGGVPKQAVDEVEVDGRGVVGDRQANRVHHGRPWQAVCLWSMETIAALQAEGHGIAPGAAGENVTIAGVDWRVVRPGTRLALGDDVVLECAPFTLPCAKNARWFREGEIDRMHHERGPGWSRIYATVLRPGSVRVGDRVVLEPSGTRP